MNFLGDSLYIKLVQFRNRTEQCSFHFFFAFSTLYKSDNLDLYGPVCFNSLLNDKFLDWSKLKAFTDDKINAT